jgi:hypothetical protein
VPLQKLQRCCYPANASADQRQRDRQRRTGHGVVFFLCADSWGPAPTSLVARQRFISDLLVLRPSDAFAPASPRELRIRIRIRIRVPTPNRWGAHVRAAATLRRESCWSGLWTDDVGGVLAWIWRVTGLAGRIRREAWETWREGWLFRCCPPPSVFEARGAASRSRRPVMRSASWVVNSGCEFVIKGL